ncbi:hypothetical protein RchiOBHm_Chr6g0260741 [Rosa chinensis]|uniref:Uncharacterized protein n=1 Tax=Rosa chinensis TaxID=74649 RepID=A0A2P6PN79_ROSCH|nr:hypothetical protein RchiOBHm_Chr6g0260741 [Rosa chinensis]
MASIFCQELFLLHFHSTDHVGLEGHYHWLLQLIVFASVMAALAATCCQTSLLAALVLSISVVFQGCWFMNMGFIDKINYNSFLNLTVLVHYLILALPHVLDTFWFKHE